MSAAQRILVTGVGAPPGLACLRSLRESPLDVTLFSADAAPYAAGLFEPGATPVRVPSAREPGRYRAALKAVCARHGVDLVIPCSEAEVEALSPVAEDWRSDGLEVAVPQPETARYGVDKGALLALAHERALPAPKTLEVSAERDLEAWSGGYPCVLKPRRSRGARGVRYPDDAQALRDAFREVAPVEGECLVQSLIPGGPETVYTVGTVHVHGRRLLSTVHRKLATNPPSGGAAIAGETVVDEAIRKAGLEVIDATGPWHGFAAVELKRPAPDAEPQLLEINPRLWGFAQMMTLAGVNAPEILVRGLRGEFDAAAPPHALTRYRAIRVVRSWSDTVIPDGHAIEEAAS